MFWRWCQISTLKTDKQATTVFFRPFLLTFSCFCVFLCDAECRKQNDEGEEEKTRAIHLIGFSSIAHHITPAPTMPFTPHRLIIGRSAKNIAHQVVFKYFYFDWVFHIKHECRTHTLTHRARDRQTPHQINKKMKRNFRSMKIICVIRWWNFN